MSNKAVTLFHYLSDTLYMWKDKHNNDYPSSAPSYKPLGKLDNRLIYLCFSELYLKHSWHSIQQFNSSILLTTLPICFTVCPLSIDDILSLWWYPSSLCLDSNSTRASVMCNKRKRHEIIIYLFCIYISRLLIGSCKISCEFTASGYIDET